MNTNDIIRQIEQEKAELKTQIEELQQIAFKLQSYGLESAELDVCEKMRGLMDKHNSLCDDIGMLKADIQREKNFERKVQRTKAESDGALAYWEAIGNGSYRAVCNYKAKDLKKAWLKGYEMAAKANGWIDSPLFAA